MFCLAPGPPPHEAVFPQAPCPPQTEGPFRASHLCHCEGGSILKPPWVSPSVWYVAGESDNRMCFQKGDPLNPCVLTLNSRDPVLIPCIGRNTLIIHLWALPVEVGRSRLVEVPDNPPSQDRQLREEGRRLEGGAEPLSLEISKVTRDMPMSTPQLSSPSVD